MPRLLALALVLLLSGCGDGGVETPTPTPSATPVFASDEEALAAAVEAYAAYSAMEDLIAQEGGFDPERLRTLVSPEWLEREIDAFEIFQASGQRQVGSTEVGDAVLQQVSVLSDSRVEVSIYVCVDFSGISFVGSDGSITLDPPVRRSTVEATFQGNGNGLVLAESDQWKPEC